MAKHILEIQKRIWEGLINRLTLEYEAGNLSRTEYTKKVDDLLDDILKMNQELQNLSDNENK